MGEYVSRVLNDHAQTCAAAVVHSQPLYLDTITGEQFAALFSDDSWTHLMTTLVALNLWSYAVMTDTTSCDVACIRRTTAAYNEICHV